MRVQDTEPWFAPYCRYCGFDFEVGQSVMALTDRGRVSTPYEYPWKEVDQVTKLFPEWMANSELPDVSYRAWAGVPYGCHVACFEFATAKFVDAAGDHAQSVRLFRASERVFKPTARYSKRRFTWMQERLATCLQLQHPSLPLELCLAISGDLVPEYAVASLASVTPRSSGGGGREERRCLVDRSADIWARYVHLDGVRYVASLSNSSGRGHTTLLHAAGKDGEDGGNTDKYSPPVGLNMVEDHLGIVDVQCYSGTPDYGGESPTRYVDIQWRSLQFGDGKYISTISD
ncbi:hypothetical protein PG984_000079 [Apiospora sp. TS-2023a]